MHPLLDIVVFFFFFFVVVVIVVVEFVVDFKWRSIRVKRGIRASFAAVVVAAVVVVIGGDQVGILPVDCVSFESLDFGEELGLILE